MTPCSLAKLIVQACSRDITVSNTVPCLSPEESPRPKHIRCSVLPHTPAWSLAMNHETMKRTRSNSPWHGSGVQLDERTELTC